MMNIKIINKNSTQFISTNKGSGNYYKNKLHYYEGEINHKKNNISQKTKKIYLNKINIFNVFLIQQIIYILLFPLYLSKKNSFGIRKLDYLQRIKIYFIGKDILYYLSSQSEITIPKYITVDNQNKDGHTSKYFNFLTNRTHNLTMQYGYNDEKIFSFKKLFSGMDYLTRVDFSEFDNKINDMTNMPRAKFVVE